MAENEKKGRLALSAYYQVVNPKGLSGGFELVNPKQPASDSYGIHEQVMNLIVNSDRFNASSMDDITKGIDSFASKADNKQVLHSIIQVYSDSSAPSGATYTMVDGNDVKLSKSLGLKNSSTISKSGVIFSNSPYVSLNVRNVDQVTLFLQAIPTLEMSKAVPFFDVNFQFNRASLTPDKFKYSVPSLIKFLEGAVGSATEDNAAGKMMRALETKTANSVVTEVDMSLFTSPQTLVNPDLANHGEVRTIAGPIGDKFRPLASLNNIHISIVSSPSYTVAYKSLDMDLTLHDRSRLAEIADLIRPETYVGTTMVIRYGWSHPDDGRENPYAELINSMRVEERYGIKNASYSFDETGQVKIKLQMYMLGENQLWISRISEDESYRSLETKFEELRQKIYEMVGSLGLVLEPETRAYQIMNAVNSGVDANLDDKKLLADIAAFTAQLKANKKGGEKQAAAQALADNIKAAIGDSKTGIRGMKEQLKRTIENVMKEKIQSLTDAPDLFLPTAKKVEAAQTDAAFVPRYSSLLKNAVDKTKKDKPRYYYASLAKIFSLFVVEPLRASNRFDEVQVIFYPFNNACGKAGGSNIGHFPIKIDTFKKVLTDDLTNRGAKDMSLAQFADFLKSAFIADPSSIAYGITNAYNSPNGKEPAKPKSANLLESAQQQALADGPGSGGSWQNPNIEFYVECLSKADSTSEIKQRLGKSSAGSILRIHVYDKVSSPWEGFMKLKAGISQLNNANISTAKNADGKSVVQQITDAINNNEPLKKALGLVGSGVKLDENKNIALDQIAFDVQKIKKIISTYVPTLVYGTQGSGLLKANLQSIQEPRLAAVNLIRSAGTTSTEPAGSGPAGLPLRIIPGQMEMTMIGCPTLCINQQFFIDFGTNTSLDNLYSLTQASHNIGPGRFETSAKFIWADAYGSYENLALKLKSLAALIEKSVK